MDYRLINETFENELSPVKRFILVEMNDELFNWLVHRQQHAPLDIYHFFLIKKNNFNTYKNIIYYF